MEEIYLLLEDRLLNMDDLIIRSNKLEELRGKLTINQNNRPPEFQELSLHLNQLKRIEKLRCIKENDALEMVFGLRSFDSLQRQRFQERSYEIMKKLKKEFVYEKYRKTGETKDIAKLYLNFFLAQKLQSKVDDLKRAYANNKFIGYPIVSVLLKWLVEIERKAFLELLKDKSDLLTFWMTNKAPKSPTISPKNHKKKFTRFEKLNAEALETIKDQQESARPTTEHMKRTIDPLRMDRTNGFHKERESLSNENTARPRTIEMRISTDNVKRSYRASLEPQKNEKTIEDIKDTSRTNKPSKPIQKEKEKEKAPNYIQIYVQHNNQIHSYLDPLEDLDISHVSTVYQVIHLYRQVKKISGGNLIVLDLDKKKEMMTTLYKNLYQRNWEVERTVTNYQNKLKERDDIDYQPNNMPRKGENFCENYSINFAQRFPHVMPSANNIQESAAKQKNDQPSSNPLTFRHTNSQKKLAIATANSIHSSITTACTMATIEQNNTMTIPDKIIGNPNDSQDERVETIERSIVQRTEEPEIAGRHRRSNSMKAENQFRIMRKKMNLSREPIIIDKKKLKRTGSWRQSIDDKNKSSLLTQSAILKTNENEETQPSLSIIKLKSIQKNPFSERYRSNSVHKLRTNVSANIQWEQVNQLKPNGIPTEPEPKMIPVPAVISNRVTDFLLKVSFNEFRATRPESHRTIEREPIVNHSFNNAANEAYGVHRKSSLPNNGKRPMTGILFKRRESDELKDQTNDSSYINKVDYLCQTAKNGDSYYFPKSQGS